LSSNARSRAFWEDGGNELIPSNVISKSATITVIIGAEVGGDATGDGVVGDPPEGAFVGIGPSVGGGTGADVGGTSGDAVGVVTGIAVGTTTGAAVGGAIGAADVGGFTGAAVGGDISGDAVGVETGIAVGTTTGAAVGGVIGAADVGGFTGAAVGGLPGAKVGIDNGNNHWGYCWWQPWC
jgi:hypothetical protein